MKSYVRFLSRNKLYTIIMSVGLSVSMAFVLLLANVVINNLSCDKMIRDKDNLYLVRTEDSGYYRADPEVVFPMIADIADWCNFVEHAAYDGKTQYIHTPDGSFRQDINPLTARSNFFDFFGLEMVDGDPSEVLAVRNAAVVSESLANIIWPNTDPVGQTLILTEARMKDVELIVTGVYKDYEKSTLADNGLVVRYDFITEIENANNPSYISGAIKPSTVHFVRLNAGADIEAIEKFLGENNETDPVASMRVDTKFEVQAFKDIHYDSRVSGRHTLKNIVDKGIYSTFLFACLILLAFSGLNYISLTMAFSRFRVKEMATRQLLGTAKGGIISRCITESAMLVTVSWIIATALAFALQQSVSSLLEAPIKLYSTPAEWILSIALITVISIAAGMIPAVSILRYKPVEVVKGESRHRDKVVLGKVFIGIEGALSIASVAIALAIFAQTSHMVNTPMGYQTEGLIYVDFGSYKEQRFEDELLAQSYVDTIGHLYSAPTRPYAMMSYIRIQGEDPMTIKGNDGSEAAFRMLGFEVIEDYGTATVNRFGESQRKMYCETTYRNLENHIKGNQVEGMIAGQIDGIIKDFRMGNVKEPETSIGYYFTIREAQKFDNILVKVYGSVEEGAKSIKEMYSTLKPQDQQPEVTPLADLVTDNYKEEQRILAMVGLFAFLNILMTIMAIIALSGYYAQMQTKDVAIMKSFGCSRRRIFGTMVIGFTWPVLAACTIAVPAVWIYIQHWLEKYPERIGNHAWIYVSAIVIVLVIVSLMISFQAYKLMNTNPASELKKE